jgi:hypothetical protein
MQNPKNIARIENLMKEVHLQEIIVNVGEQSLNGKSFCITGSLNHYSNREELKEIDIMKALFMEGIEILESIDAPNDRLLKLINMGKFMYRTCITGEHVKRMFILTQKLNIEPDKKAALELLDEIELLLLKEKENVEKRIPIVQVDSRLGWEPSMEYQGDEKCLEWKLRQLSYDLTYTLPKHRECCK